MRDRPVKFEVTHGGNCLFESYATQLFLLHRKNRDHPSLGDYQHILEGDLEFSDKIQLLQAFVRGRYVEGMREILGNSSHEDRAILENLNIKFKLQVRGILLSNRSEAWPSGAFGCTLIGNDFKTLLLMQRSKYQALSDEDQEDRLDLIIRANQDTLLARLAENCCFSSEEAFLVLSKKDRVTVFCHNENHLESPVHIIGEGLEGMPIFHMLVNPDEGKWDPLVSREENHMLVRERFSSGVDAPQEGHEDSSAEDRAVIESVNLFPRDGEPSELSSILEGSENIGSVSSQDLICRSIMNLYPDVDTSDRDAQLAIRLQDKEIAEFIQTRRAEIASGSEGPRM